MCRSPLLLWVGRDDIRALSQGPAEPYRLFLGLGGEWWLTKYSVGSFLEPNFTRVDEGTPMKFDIGGGRTHGLALLSKVYITKGGYGTKS